MPEKDYVDLVLRIEPEGEQRYVAHVKSSVGEISLEFGLPAELRSEILTPTAAYVRPESEHEVENSSRRMEAVGRQLFDSIFSGSAENHLRLCINEARQRGAGLRLQLDLGSPELHELPWELLYDRQQERFLTLCDAPSIIVTRQPSAVESIRPASRIVPPLRVLVVFDAEREWNAVRRALSNPIRRRSVTLDGLKEPTLEALQQQLQAQEYHIVHFSGHGGWDPNTGEQGLLLENSNRAERFMSGTTLRGLLQSESSLRFVFLYACRNARQAPEPSILPNLAERLAHGGVPAVLAMKYSISHEAASAFASEFYKQLVDHEPIDVAVARARRCLFHREESTEWLTPVLYTRALKGEGRLILPEQDDIAQTPLEGSQAPLGTDIYAYAVARLSGFKEENPLIIGREYQLQAGISVTQLEGFVQSYLHLHLDDPQTTVQFLIIVRADKMTVSPWSQTLVFDGQSKEPQLATFTLRPEQYGPSEISVDFYHERHWLQTLKLNPFIVAAVENKPA